MKRLILAVFALALSFSANAVLIDFTAMPDGNVSTIGDATFSLAGSGEAGDPYVENRFGGGLWNSSDGATYPTNTILRVDFASAVTDLSWTFDNEGGKATTFTIFDSLSNVLATGLNNTSSGFQAYDYSALVDVAAIEWNNNGNNWLFALGQIEYESADVPEPAAFWLFGLGLLGVYFSRKRSNA